MTPEQMMGRIIQLEQRLNSWEKSDRYISEKNIQMQDGRNFQVGRGTGTKIGTAIDQKLGFFGSTPVLHQQIAFPVIAGDLYTALNNLGLVYH